MKPISALGLALVFAVAVTGPIDSASANLVQNGTFEAPVVASGTYSIFLSIPGWATAFGPGIEIQNHVAGSPFEGRQFVELDSNANSGMYQDLATVAGESYLLSFAHSPRPGVNANSNGIDVFWGGSVVTNLALSGVGLPDTLWKVYSFNLVATSSTTRLQFNASGLSESLGGYIDAVAVAPVPEPTTIVPAMIALVGGAGFMARRRRAA